ncbi:TetR/AcrR family transcriptional regulator [Plasticicumulans acidivorans]|uniref:TetR family transcriptional regulator n=1 Tax=Plasticicumulans acidivorans TaxID=886464 RepID=A0A317MS97_9GAMM|nr:TetR/AcrR family transcriptional regulator [Plasticicumulans acidivorans]PWV59846.1 TetR family transcriptional regulator [Plasticicumulans acidivorans]
MTKEPTGRRERKRQQTADAIADTAWQLFESEGYATVTMEAIAAAADVAKGTLYKHFPVKEALLRHRFHRELAEALTDLLTELDALPSAAARLHAFFARSAEWSQTRRDYLPHYLRYRLNEPCNERLQQQRSGLEDIFTRLIAAGQRSGEFRAQPSAAVAAQYLSFLQLGALMRWLNEPAIELGTEYGAMLDLFLHGLEVTP